MVSIYKLSRQDSKTIDDVVEIQLDAFRGFFLTSMGRGFLKNMYESYCIHNESGLYVAQVDNKIVGFIAYSYNMSNLYKWMIKKKLIPFAWYSLGAFFRNPKAFSRIVRAFTKPGESKRDEKYVKLSSIAVRTDIQTTGVGSKLIQALIADVNFEEYSYISLETDAINNDEANNFYKKNGFELAGSFETPEKRIMNEYRFWLKRR